MITFALGLLVAIVLNNERLKGQRFYRSLLILPYAMPAFAMYLVWRDMFNTDFGLINRLFGLDVNWFGTPTTARIAILLIQLWLGYSYMFLVLHRCPAGDPGRPPGGGAGRRRQAVPRVPDHHVPAAAGCPGAAADRVVRVQLQQLQRDLPATAVAPFPPDNPTAGATDLLITYTYRLAFGGAGAQYGFAAAISIFIFLIVAVISIVGFRSTQALEEIN